MDTQHFSRLSVGFYLHFCLIYSFLFISGDQGCRSDTQGSWITHLHSAPLKISPFFNRLFLYLLQNFAKEFVISDHKELDEDYIKNELKKAGGANYDAQTE